MEMMQGGNGELIRLALGRKSTGMARVRIVD